MAAESGKRPYFIGERLNRITGACDEGHRFGCAKVGHTFYSRVRWRYRDADCLGVRYGPHGWLKVGEGRQDEVGVFVATQFV